MAHLAARAVAVPVTVVALAVAVVSAAAVTRPARLEVVAAAMVIVVVAAVVRQVLRPAVLGRTMACLTPSAVRAAALGAAVAAAAVAVTPTLRRGGSIHQNCHRWIGTTSWSVLQEKKHTSVSHTCRMRTSWSRTFVGRGLPSMPAPSSQMSWSRGCSESTRTIMRSTGPRG